MNIIELNPNFLDLSLAEASIIIGGAKYPDLKVYEDINFGGDSAGTNFDTPYVGNYWNDRISAINIVSGTWTFYRDANYQGDSITLGPGLYSWVENVGIPNDSVSSFKATA